ERWPASSLILWESLEVREVSMPRNCSYPASLTAGKKKNSGGSGWLAPAFPRFRSDDPRGGHRYGAHGIPRCAGAPHGKARRGALFPRPCGGGGVTRLHLSLHRRYRYGAAPRLQVDLLGERLRGYADGPGHGHAAPHSLVAENCLGLLRCVYGRESADRGSAALGAAASGRARRRGRIYGQDRIRARALPIQRVLRRSTNQALPWTDAGFRVSRR